MNFNALSSRSWRMCSLGGLVCILYLSCCSKGTNVGTVNASITKPDEPLVHFKGDLDFEAGMRCYSHQAYDSAAYYFMALTAKHPYDSYAWTWRAKVFLNRISNECSVNAVLKDSCRQFISRAMDLNPRNSFALEMYAECHNPAFGFAEKGNDDINWEYLQKAVELDPSDGDAWSQIRIQALMRGDRVMAKKALSKLSEANYFSASIMELNRWMLRQLPQHAVFITGADHDMFPSEILQAAQKERPDVTIVSGSLLNLASYIEDVGKRIGQPVPIQHDKMELYEGTVSNFSKLLGVPASQLDPDYDPQQTTEATGKEGDQYWYFLSTAIIRWWCIRYAEGKFDRPIVFSPLCEHEIMKAGQPLKDCGAYKISSIKSGASFDWDAVRKSFLDADGKKFTGNPFSDIDRSAERRSLPGDYAGSLPYAIGKSYAEYLRARLKERNLALADAARFKAELKSFLKELDRFAEEAKLSADTIEQ
jgi:hypothetical protein